MAEERTQAPSKRHRQQARERGQVARSPELTAAVGLLAAVVLLGLWGADLSAALINLVREPLQNAPEMVADPGAVAARFRHAALSVAVPVGAVLGGVLAAILTAHQLQVGGLWVPGLLAPDPGRLWGGGGAGVGARSARGAWSLAKSVIVVAVAAWTIGSHLNMFARLSFLEVHALARASGFLIRDLGYMLALAILALGLLDFVWQYGWFEAQLRLTPQEQREDQRADDGDPALRARRRRIAQGWHLDLSELMVGASLVLTGPAGLTVLLGGGPPPKRTTVRTAVQGLTGLRLRRAAARARVPQVETPDLARRLSRRHAPGLADQTQIRTELAALWPARSATAKARSREDRPAE
jgi:flagellar biosynthesis protein FlhB